MITIPTTIVLGAGASKPYGMPLGAELRDIICHANYSDSTIALHLERMFHIDREKTLDFSNSFLRSKVASIDAFLSKNAQFTDIGKLCIAVVLCSKEEPEAITSSMNKDDWYHYLWQILIADTHAANDLLKNKISFITFNYDRSLEFFIHQSTKHTFNISDEEALSILKQMKILHVYGELGEFDYKSTQDARTYTSDFNAQQISIAAKGIKVIPEARNNDEMTFKKAREWFDSSENIGFLGFGFDSLNVERLGLKDIIKKRAEEGRTISAVIASTLGKTRIEEEKIARSLWPADPGRIEVFSGTNTMTIRSSRLL